MELICYYKESYGLIFLSWELLFEGKVHFVLSPRYTYQIDGLKNPVNLLLLQESNCQLTMFQWEMMYTIETAL